MSETNERGNSAVADDVPDVPKDDQSNFKFQLQYALEHFTFHAKQRTTMFHFFLIASGVLANAIVLLVKEKLFIFAGILALVGAFISYGFNCLDKRNKQLVKYSEHVLKFLEDDKLFKGKKYEGVTLGFLLREHLERETPIEKEQAKLKHGIWISRIQRLTLLVFLLVAIFVFVESEPVRTFINMLHALPFCVK